MLINIWKLLGFRGKDKSATKPLLTISPVPPKVDLNDIKPNGKLLTQEQIFAVKNADLDDGSITPEEFKKEFGINIPCSVLRKGDDYFAAYHKPLGAGAFGEVRLLQNLKTGEWITKKLIRANENSDLNELNQNVEAEIAGLKKAKQFLGHFETPEGGHEILMKLAPGTNLDNVTAKQKNIPIVRLVDLSIGTLEYIEDNLHKSNLLHRDIKGENINYDATTRKVTPLDYGFAKVAKRTKEGLSITENIGKGTGGYMAPEVLAMQSDISLFSDKSDVYALGITLGEMYGLTRKAEPTDSPLDKMRETLIVEDAHENFKNNMRIPNEAMKLAIWAYLVRMTAENPKDRPTLPEAIRYFKAIREQLLDANTLLSPISYLNIQDYKDASP